MNKKLINMIQVLHIDPDDYLVFEIGDKKCIPSEDDLIRVKSRIQAMIEGLQIKCKGCMFLTPYIKIKQVLRKKEKLDGKKRNKTL